MKSEVREELKQFLLTHVRNAKLASGGREIVGRCHMCLDSPDPNKSHLYISLGDDTKPPLFHCFLCQESGLVDGKFLRSLNIYDPNLISDVNSEISKMSRQVGNQIYNNNVVWLNHDCNYNRDEVTVTKLAYINNRLGLSLTYKDLNDLKIVLNIYDLLMRNGINQYTRHWSVMEEIDANFIGFLSADNCYLNMRNLNLFEESENIRMRYINYNIFGKADNSARYYIIPTEVDLTSPEPINIHIAEGPFDILSIALNVNKCIGNNIYMAIGGKAYLNAIKYFIEKLGLINIIINIYIDNDIDTRSIYNIINYLSPFRITFKVFRNGFEGEKDFGVPSDRIKVMQIY